MIFGQFVYFSPDVHLIRKLPPALQYNKKKMNKQIMWVEFKQHLYIHIYGWVVRTFDFRPSDHSLLVRWLLDAIDLGRQSQRATSLEITWKPYHRLTHVLWNSEAIINRCASRKSQVIVIKGFSILTLFKLISSRNYN